MERGLVASASMTRRKLGRSEDRSKTVGCKARPGDISSVGQEGFYLQDAGSIGSSTQDSITDILSIFDYAIDSSSEIFLLRKFTCTRVIAKTRMNFAASRHC